ncbi:hypothetical protein JCM3765_002729 [Sporobolomyces pararoseus]
MQHSQHSARLQPPPLFHSASSSILLHQSEDAPPHKVPVRSSFSRITPTEPGDPFPSISAEDQVRVKNWIDRDLAFEQALSEARQRKRAEIIGIAEEIVTGQDWLGPPAPPEQLRIRWDDEKDREQASKTRGPLRKPIKLSKRQMRSAASRNEILIPIRLEIEHEAWKLRDTFTWNLLETDITPETFASHLCADLRLPERPFLKEIITTIKKAIEDAQASDQYETLVGDSGLRELEENRKWFEEKAYERRRQPLMNGIEEETDMALERQTVSTGDANGEELRITIKLDITLDATQLVDRVEWDIANPRNSPEEFAEIFTSELGLTGEFKTAIAHSIREQVDTYVKSLSLLNYTSTGSITDDDLRKEFLPAVQDVFRSETVDLYSPSLNQLSNEDVDRNEKEREREIRRKRRQTKGRGVTLPDREAVKTHRTLVPRPLAGLMQTQINGGDVVYPMPELSHPYPLVVKPLPAKPKGLESSESSPLRLVVKERDAPTGPAHPLRGAALANSMAKRARLAGEPSLHQQHEGRPEDFGLHDHILDGRWHCANCGVPDTLAIGRRKGPTGVHNLCGTCGKFYQRYRKQRVCQYTTNYDHHLQLRNQEEAKANPSKRIKRGTASVATTSTEGTPAMIDARPRGKSGPPQTASRSDSPSTSLQRSKRGDDVEDEEEEEDEEGNSDDSDPVRPPTRKKRRANHYGSPDTPFVIESSDSGSDSEDESDEDEPNEGTAAPPPPPPPTRSNPIQAQPVAPRLPSSAPNTVPPEPQPWMIKAASELRGKQVDDRFELIPKPKAGDPTNYEWRIRCLDCPGKLYNLGPGQTFDGFLVHFKNRNHRTNVETRLTKQRQALQQQQHQRE